MYSHFTGYFGRFLKYAVLNSKPYDSEALFFILRSEYYRKNDQIDYLKNSLFVKI